MALDSSAKTRLGSAVVLFVLLVGSLDYFSFLSRSNGPGISEYWISSLQQARGPPTKEPPTKEPPTKEPPTKEPPTKEPPTTKPPTTSPPTRSPTTLPTTKPPTTSPPTESPTTLSTTEPLESGSGGRKQAFLEHWRKHGRLDPSRHTLVDLDGSPLELPKNTPGDLAVLLMGDSIDRFSVMDDVSRAALSTDCLTTQEYTSARTESINFTQSEHVVLRGPAAKPPPQADLYMIRCTTKPKSPLDMLILFLCVAWGSHPYGPVHYYNPAITGTGINAFVPGLADVQPEMPSDFSQRLQFMWEHKWPEFQRLRGKRVLVVWNVNLWQIANMNHVTVGGFFESISSDYIEGFAKNITVHINAMEGLLRKTLDCKITSLVRLCDEEHTYQHLFKRGKTQNPHLRALNKGLSLAARKSGALLLDMRNATSSLKYASVMRDSAHPQPWVLQQFWKLYLNVASIS